MDLDQGKSLDKAERVEIWEEAHRKTISWLFDNNHIDLR
jgi:hypothetical protein